jgi:isoleucine--tRNA ligase
LAEAEVEYAEHISPSITVAFEINNGNKYVAKGDYVLI